MYFIFFFTLFNSNWAEKTIEEIEALPDISLVQPLDSEEQEDINSDAISTGSKILKYSSPQNVEYLSADIFSEYKLFRKIQLPDISLMLVCGVKSFLHLLQLY